MYAEKHGVTKAVICYRTNHQYIYRWRKRYDRTLKSLESRRPTALIACRGDYDIAALLDEKTGQMLRWRHTK